MKDTINSIKTALAQNPDARIQGPDLTSEDLATMPTSELEALVQLCREYLDALHARPVYWTGAQWWTEILVCAQSHLRYRRDCARDGVQLEAGYKCV